LTILMAGALIGGFIVDVLLNPIQVEKGAQCAAPDQRCDRIEAPALQRQGAMRSARASLPS
jgi:hypothetical protein